MQTPLVKPDGGEYRSHAALRRPVRWTSALMFAGSSAALILSLVLSPDARGYGTHEQLGLPPCGFLASFGMPCPFCGATTSVCLVMRGRFIAALRAQPIGLFVTAAILGTFARSFFCLWNKKLFFTPSFLSHWKSAVFLAFLLFALCWFYKISIGVGGRI